MENSDETVESSDERSSIDLPSLAEARLSKFAEFAEVHLLRGSNEMKSFHKYQVNKTPRAP